jgi:hypothetical protein
MGKAAIGSFERLIGFRGFGPAGGRFCAEIVRKRRLPPLILRASVCSTGVSNARILKREEMLVPSGAGRGREVRSGPKKGLMPNRNHDTMIRPRNT